MRLCLLISTLLSTRLAEGRTQKACTSKYGTSLVKDIQETHQSFTHFRTLTKLVKVTPVTTVTPPIVTSTISSTQISTSWLTAPVIKDTYTISQTVTLTETRPTIDSHTQTTTTTTTTTISSTTTIAAPNGFTALANIEGFIPKRGAVLERGEAIEVRDADNFKILPPIAVANKNSHRPGNLFQAPKKIKNSIPQYVSSVFCCVTTTKYQTVTASRMVKRMATITAPAETSFTTITVQSTVTKTSVHAQLTVTITGPVTTSVTKISIRTTTTTMTDTQTIYAPSATYLAQCAPENILSSAIGQKIGYISFNKAFSLYSLTPTDTTGYGCCAACANSVTCASYGQHPNGVCYYITTDNYDGTQGFGDGFHYYNTTGPGYIVGNGQRRLLNTISGS